jgi:hypothetical protein
MVSTGDSSTSGTMYRIVDPKRSVFTFGGTLLSLLIR